MYGSSTLFLTSALEGGEGSASRPGRTLPPGKDPVPIVQEAGWSSGPLWTGEENLAPTGIRSPDRPARKQSIYRLSYRGPCIWAFINLSKQITYLQSGNKTHIQGVSRF